VVGWPSKRPDDHYSPQGDSTHGHPAPAPQEPARLLFHALPFDPEYAELARLVRPLYDTVRTELSTLIDMAADTVESGEQGEDMLVEAVRQLSLTLTDWGMRATDGSIPDDD
jgi:hypothetical protein